MNGEQHDKHLYNQPENMEICLSKCVPWTIDQWEKDRYVITLGKRMKHTVKVLAITVNEMALLMRLESTSELCLGPV